MKYWWVLEAAGLLQIWGRRSSFRLVGVAPTLMLNYMFSGRTSVTHPRTHPRPQAGRHGDPSQHLLTFEEQRSFYTFYRKKFILPLIRKEGWVEGNGLKLLSQLLHTSSFTEDPITEGGRFPQQTKAVRLLICRFNLKSFLIFFLIVHFLLDPLGSMLELFMDSIFSNGRFPTWVTPQHIKKVAFQFLLPLSSSFAA